MYNLKWTNKYSCETGYVKKVSKAKGYFENTFEKAEAKKYRSMKAVQTDIELLTQLGEAVNNVFEAEEM
jgi:hypothetical protein